MVKTRIITIPFFKASRLNFRNNPKKAAINCLSLSSFKLFFWLHELKQRYARDKDWFFHSDGNMAENTGLSEKTIRKARKELARFGFIQTWKMATIENGKKTSVHITAYRLLK